jgi:hypothetical protein
MKNKNLITAIALIIVIAIIIILVYMFIGKKPVITNQNMTTNELVGKWNAISEEMNGEVNNNLEDYYIVFYDDYTYSETIVGVNTKGMYKIAGNNITLYQKGDDLSKPGRYNKGYYEIKNDQLTLNLPIYPKTVVYKKAVI